MTTAPTIHLNDQPLPWREALTLAALLAEQGHAPEAVATAVNAAFVPRAARAHTRLAPGDHITLFQAIVGG
ncbi:MAG: sulfur carrier protein ThiS [Proteobacteria bacterium]|nr:sulfur carrier protein ThiS [Pseudomonadota bacterium]